MKLLFCRQCGDVLKLRYEPRTCECGRASGQYRKDGEHADVSDGADVIGVDNYTLRAAVQGHHSMLNAWLFDRAEADRVHWPETDLNAAYRAKWARKKARKALPAVKPAKVERPPCNGFCAHECPTCDQDRSVNA